MHSSPTPNPTPSLNPSSYIQPSTSSPQHLTSIFYPSFKQQSNLFTLQISMIATTTTNPTTKQLCIKLKDIKEGMLYEKIYTEKTQKSQKSQMMNISIQDVYYGLRRSINRTSQGKYKGQQEQNTKIQQSEETKILILDPIQKYQYGTIIQSQASNSTIKHYRLQPQGKLYIYKNLLNNNRQNKPTYFSSCLHLNKIRTLTSTQIVQQMQSYYQKIFYMKEVQKINKEGIREGRLEKSCFLYRIHKLEENQTVLMRKLEEIQNIKKQAVLKKCCLLYQNHILQQNQGILNKRLQQMEKINKILMDKVIDQQKIISQLKNKNNNELIDLSKQQKLKTQIDIVVSPTTTLTYNTAVYAGKSYRCSVGKNGTTSFKKQGDGKTPVGTFAFRQIFIRPDRLTIIQQTIIKMCALPVKILNQYDGWCDQPSSPYYNKYVDLRTFDNTVSHQNLWREDNLYDCFLVIGWNDQPVIAGRGSAIFMHIARQGYTGTAGCVAFSRSDLFQIIRKMHPESQITVKEQKDGVEEELTGDDEIDNDFVGIVSDGDDDQFCEL